MQIIKRKISATKEQPKSVEEYKRVLILMVGLHYELLMGLSRMMM